MDKKSKINKKGQIFSADLAIAIIAFMFIILTFIYMGNHLEKQVQINEESNDLIRIGHYFAAILVETPGEPSNWTDYSSDEFNSSNIKSLGLATSSSSNNLNITEKGKSVGTVNDNCLVLDSNKINYLTTLNASHYETYKELLGVIGPGYEFQLIVKMWNGTDYQQQYQIGETPQYNAPYITRTDRFALMDDTWTHLIFQVWKRCLQEPC